MHSAKGKKSKLNMQPSLILPDSPISCSDDELPIPIKSGLLNYKRAKWHKILEDSNERMKEIEDYEKSKRPPPIPKALFRKTSIDYMQTEVFDCLLPALEDTLKKAALWQALRYPGCFFNGIDWIVQEIWNNNPRHPTRKFDQKHVFNMKWVRDYLTLHPRPLFPKSWLWPEEYAATVIQKSVRQYFVQQLPEVQEMRKFWKRLQFERKNADIEKNLFMAKKLAESNMSELCIRQEKSRKNIFS